VEAGTVKLVGTDVEKIVSQACLLLDNEDERRRMSRVHNPYGDGQASRRIADAIAAYSPNYPK
jgi:UDP-N-acetylglucosamine 2-epimerase (non-hydrolysing)